jgi:CheY-like chemotaxis protein
MLSAIHSADIPTATRVLSVLLADEPTDSRRVMQQWLEELGHRVWCASSGIEALRLIHHRMVDLVITEVLLPDGDGIEVITGLRKFQPSARVVALSGGGRYLSAPQCLRVAQGLGANAVLLKPASRDELLAAVATAIAHGTNNHSLVGTEPIAAPQTD